MQSEILAPMAGVARDLAEVVHRIRRLIRHRLRAEWGASPLPEAQLEIVRLLRSRPGLRVQEAAGALGVAPNTVSTLVRQLEAAGLLERSGDEGDGRVTRLRLTPVAEERIARWHDARQALVAAALASLSEEDRRRIRDALPALGRLAQALGRDGCRHRSEARAPDRAGTGLPR
ncbi:MAG TPA: MarR family transcriptional regulator [Candidatus Dormibacteraeota bacterium]|nr:MarR family transcriptional regulator [Candidatus Dormibacteraeota bacterium]